MAFIFTSPVDPENPLDINDLPPEGWDYVDTKDYRQALFSVPSVLFTECTDWQVRELARIQAAVKQGV